ncbi:MAG: tyrosine--tRNA ligase [Patescibacteria group bacterium]
MKKILTIANVLGRQVKEILPNKKGLEFTMKKKKIRLYLGVDPTGKYLHLGHTIVLRKLQQFADLGHEAILVVGTGTVLAGDPSQRAIARPLITQQEIKENIKTWKKQASKILDFSKIKMRFNGDWLLKLQLPDIVTIASNISAAHLFQRDMFQARLKRGDTVWTHELLYPLLQGYDSVALEVDLEIGGTDQLFNMLVGRELQKKMRNREKYVLTTPMLLGLDGNPMSKTSGNTVNILDDPQDMYGKLMSMKDDLIPHYFELCTEVRPEEIKNLAPRDAKARLAREIVTLYHSKAAAKKAEQEFNAVFQKGQIPSEIQRFGMEQIPMPLNLTNLVFKVGLANSKSEARRLIAQGGIKVDGKVKKDPVSVVQLRKGMVLQKGKRRFIEIA